MIKFIMSSRRELINGAALDNYGCICFFRKKDECLKINYVYIYEIGNLDVGKCMSQI